MQIAEQRRPWYYQRWFLVLAFILGWPVPVVPILWPVWPFLMLRSPWHPGVVLRSLAWAMLLSGGIMLALQAFSSRFGPAVLVFFLPGVVLAVVTQVHWSRHKGQFASVALGPASASAASRSRVAGQPLQPGPGARRLRPHRRGRSRPGRYSRHPH